MNAAMHFLISYWVKHRLTRNRERGATAVEYTLLAAFIGLVVIAVVSALGGQIVAMLQPAVTALGG